MLKLAGCVLLDDERRILLLHRNKPDHIQWELPGGKIDRDEDDATTAIREIKEELGVSVSVTRKLGAAEFTGPDGACHYTWFLATMADKSTPFIGEPQTFDDLRYFSIDELSTLKLSPNMLNLYAAIKAQNIVL